MDKNKIIEGLYLEHKDHIYNFLARMANDPDLALDVTQQTFVKALSDKNFHQVANPKAYLFTIARNTLFNEFKKKKASSLDEIEENTEIETADETANLHADVELKDIQTKVESSIKRMPVKFKELMILRYTEDLSIKEISSITGRSLSDVKVNLHRSRIKFESAFTSEMYAKLAVSRDQCDTLTRMLEPYIDAEISDQALQHVDKHITKCKICAEDAQQLKRSRTLFNFASLLSLPYVFDKMMGEAMASEFEFLGGSAQTGKTSTTLNAAENKDANESGNSAANTSEKSTLAKNATQNVISSKVAAIAAVAFIVGGVILNSLISDDEIVIVGNPLNTPVLSPGQQGNGPAMPAGTTSVSFAAKNASTGELIKDGLQWKIFKTANVDESVTLGGSKELIQSSDLAIFNASLDAGVYLARATYKGENQQSQFTVGDDSALSINLNFLTSDKASDSDNLNLPTIHIRRLLTGTQEAQGLKMQWDSCVSMIEIYKKTRLSYPKMWAQQEQDLKEDNPGFSIDRKIATEPNWSSLTENYEDEYFSGNKYALYKTSRSYDLSEEGGCNLIVTHEKSAEIDDGKFNYYVDFINKSAEKNISAVY